MVKITTILAYNLFVAILVFLAWFGNIPILLMFGFGVINYWLYVIKIEIEEFMPLWMKSEMWKAMKEAREIMEKEIASKEQITRSIMTQKPLNKKHGHKTK